MTECERCEREHERSRWWFNCIFCGAPRHWGPCEKASHRP